CAMTESTTPRRKPPLVQILITILAIALLFGGGLMARSYLAHERLRSHLRAAIPKVCDDLCRQRQSLLDAIDAYKAKLGFYPPDHIISREPLIVDAVTNQLLYELLGTFHDPATDTF